MKVSLAQATRNRERIVEAAASMFRERGYEGTGIAQLMRSIGLAHGTFYGQFGTKTDLAVEACEFVFGRSTEAWERLLQENPAAGLGAIAQRDLQAQHLSLECNGCAAVMLCCLLARNSSDVQQALRGGVERLVALLAAASSESEPYVAREEALFAVSAMVGAVLIGSAVDEEHFSLEVLAAVARRLGDFAEAA